VTVREWDVASAPAAEIEAVVATLNAALDADLPDDPRWANRNVREYLTEMMPGERRVCWLAEAGGPADDAPGPAGGRPAGGDRPRVLGHANTLLLGDIGVVEVVVHPAARHRGVGRALVAEAVRRAAADGVSSVGVEVVEGTTAMAFWEALGFRCAYVEMRSVLDLSEVDWTATAALAADAPSGYRVEHHRGTLPDHLLEPYAATKAARRDTGPQDLDLRPSSYDARRLAASLDTLNRRGMRPYVVLAVQEQSGVVAALTEVVTPSQRPARADQYDTIVAPAHQGLGLDRVIKTRMLCELRTAEPRLEQVQTWNALEHDPMARVNAELGFRPDRRWCEYEADVADLARRLSS
jgi:GNAT superfamily N-acetyltransferase